MIQRSRVDGQLGDEDSRHALRMRKLMRDAVFEEIHGTGECSHKDLFGGKATSHHPQNVQQASVFPQQNIILLKGKNFDSSQGRISEDVAVFINVYHHKTKYKEITVASESEASATSRHSLSSITNTDIRHPTYENFHLICGHMQSQDSLQLL